jgi:hypothetical protein
MEWIQVFTIVAVNVVLIATMITVVVWAIGKMDADVKFIGDRVDKMGIRLDGHAQRIDQLYKMFVDLLKAGKP